MRIFYYSKFIRQYKKLPAEIKILVKNKELIFRDDSFDSRLKTHKLSGRLDGLYSFSINHSYRIIFRISEEGFAEFYEIGNHDIYE